MTEVETTQLSRTQAYKGRFSVNQGVITDEPADRTVRADALLSHLRSGWYVYRYRVCQCGHSEPAHGPMGCEGLTGEGEHCECREAVRS